jgi:hypothetical protein
MLGTFRSLEASKNMNKGYFRIPALQVLRISFVQIKHVNIQKMNFNRTADFHLNKYSLTIGFALSVVVKHPAP